MDPTASGCRRSTPWSAARTATPRDPTPRPLAWSTGYEAMGEAGGALGVTLAAVSLEEHDTVAKAGEKTTASILQAGLYWRRSVGGWRFNLGGGLGYSRFNGDRSLRQRGRRRRRRRSMSSLTNTAAWNGMVANAFAGAGLRGQAGRRLSAAGGPAGLRLAVGRRAQGAWRRLGLRPDRGLAQGRQPQRRPGPGAGQAVRQGRLGAAGATGRLSPDPGRGDGRHHRQFRGRDAVHPGLVHRQSRAR
jgi:hypothetical protein